MRCNLEGKVALITGAGSSTGMGCAIAQAYVRVGASVVLIDVNGAGLDKTTQVVRETVDQAQILSIVADVGDPRAVTGAVERVVEALGGVDILVNNAGVWLPETFWEVSNEDWQRARAANLDGAFYLARAVVPRMLEQGWGRIIGVTTSLDTMWSKDCASYGATKAGHESLVAIMAADLQGSPVTANVLIPGTMTYGEMTARFIGINFERHELREPEIMQSPALWLASEDSDDFTGRRIIAYRWDENLPLAKRLREASAPAAWSQLGPQFVPPGTD